jgi:ATP-dependent exoDNAse (exonuclease V) beta subunit
MPSKTAEKDWEKQQEQNLIYVAYTRAKNTLGFIDEKGFEKFDLTSTATINELERIEGLLKLILEKKSVPLTVDLANAVVKRARKVKPSVSSSETITLSDASKKSFSINDIIGRNKLNTRNGWK